MDAGEKSDACGLARAVGATLGGPSHPEAERHSIAVRECRGNHKPRRGVRSARGFVLSPRVHRFLTTYSNHSQDVATSNSGPQLSLD